MPVVLIVDALTAVAGMIGGVLSAIAGAKVLIKGWHLLRGAVRK